MVKATLYFKKDTKTLTYFYEAEDIPNEDNFIKIYDVVFPTVEDASKATTRQIKNLLSTVNMQMHDQRGRIVYKENKHGIFTNEYDLMDKVRICYPADKTKDHYGIHNILYTVKFGETLSGYNSKVIISFIKNNHAIRRFTYKDDGKQKYDLSTTYFNFLQADFEKLVDGVGALFYYRFPFMKDDPRNIKAAPFLSKESAATYFDDIFE